MNERRSSKRWRTVLGARILSKDLTMSIECMIRDLSDTGAKIYFADTTQLMPEFELEIPSRELRVQVQVVWSRGANHGVRFLEKVKVWTDPLRAAAA